MREDLNSPDTCPLIRQNIKGFIVQKSAYWNEIKK